MAGEILNLSTKRHAVVTGANKGIGFEICKQLASKGIMVILTARNKKRGLDAQERLKGHFGHSDNVVFHQLDVLDPASIASLAHFIQTNYGRLDILVNNAGVGGVILEGDASIIEELVEAFTSSILSGREPEPVKLQNGSFTETFEVAEQCVKTNYYGSKRMTEALIPLLQLSDSPRIVNVSSIFGNLRLLKNEWAKGILSNAENLRAEQIDEVVEEFLKDFKEGLVETNGWPTPVAAYNVSKAAICAHARLLAKKYPSFCINCVCPGFVRTDLTGNIGALSAGEGAESAVRLALLPDGGPSGQFFSRDVLFFF